MDYMHATPNECEILEIFFARLQMIVYIMAAILTFFSHKYDVITGDSVNIYELFLNYGH